MCPEHHCRHMWSYCGQCQDCGCPTSNIWASPTGWRRGAADGDGHA